MKTVRQIKFPTFECDYCGTLHCNVCGDEIGIVEHGPEICENRRQEFAAHYIHIQWTLGNNKEVLKELRRAEDGGWLDELEKTMTHLGFL